MSETALQKALAPRMLRKSAILALIVGSVLTLINQGDALFSGQMPVIWKLLLTYLVPFCVSTYGAWNMARSAEKGD